MASGWPVTRRLGVMGRHLSGVVGVHRDHVPARTLHRPEHHLLKGLPRLHDGQGLVGRWVCGLPFGSGVPQGSAAAVCGGCPHHQRPVAVEVGRGTRVDVRPVVGQVFVLAHGHFSFAPEYEERSRPRRDSPAFAQRSVVCAAHAAALASVPSPSPLCFSSLSCLALRKPRRMWAIASPKPSTHTLDPSLN